MVNGFIGEAYSVEAAGLDVCTWKPPSGLLPKNEKCCNCRNADLINKSQGPELLFRASAVLGHTLRANQCRNEFDLETAQVKIIQRCQRNTMGVERKTAPSPLFDQPPFLFRGCHCTARTDSDPNAVVKPDGGVVGWLDNYGGSLATFQYLPRHVHAWERQDLSIVANLRKPQKQIVIYFNVRACSIIPLTNEYYPWFSMVRQIVAECANCLPDLVKIGGGGFSFDAIRFQIAE